MNKSEQALKEIRILLQNNEIGANNTLFSENELAKIIGISRTPIRDALSVLSKEGLIEQIPQVGIRVKNFNDGDLREIYDVRDYLESYATERFAANPSPLVIKELKKCIEEMREFAEEEDVSNFLSSDTKFHEKIASGAGLNFVEELIKQIGSKIKIIGFLSTPTSESMKIVADEHMEILQAIIERNPSYAKEKAIAHLTKTKDRLEKARGRSIF